MNKTDLNDIVYQKAMEITAPYFNGEPIKGQDVLDIMDALGRAYATHLCIVADLMGTDINKFSEAATASVKSYVDVLWNGVDFSNNSKLN